jgi:hypothetical protein
MLAAYKGLSKPRLVLSELIASAFGFAVPASELDVYFPAFISQPRFPENGIFLSHIQFIFKYFPTHACGFLMGMFAARLVNDWETLDRLAALGE